jgi:hypothetical protein
VRSIILQSKYKSKASGLATRAALRLEDARFYALFDVAID